MNQVHEYVTRSAEETIELGRNLAPLLTPPKLVHALAEAAARKGGPAI